MKEGRAMVKMCEGRRQREEDAQLCGVDETKGC